MRKNIIIGVAVILVLLLVIAAEAFYLLKARPKVTFDMQGLTGEETEIGDIESFLPALSGEELYTEINGVFRDVFDILDSDEAVDEADIAQEADLADFSSDLDALSTDEKNFQEIDQAFNELSY